MECVAIFGAVSPNRNFPKRYNFVLSGYGTGKGAKRKGNICRRDLRRDGESPKENGYSRGYASEPWVGSREYWAGLGRKGMPRKIRARGV